MNVPENILEDLKKELNQILFEIDKKYAEQIKVMYFILIVAIPIILLGVLITISENYFIGIGCYLIAFALLLFGIIEHTNQRYFWKKEREHAIWIFNVKLLQISIAETMKLELVESAINSDNNDFTKDSHR